MGIFEPSARVASLPAPSPGASAAVPGPGETARAEGSPGPEADTRTAPCRWLLPRPPALPQGHLPCGDAAKRPVRPASDSRLASRQGRGRQGRHPRGGRGHGAVTSRQGGPGEATPTTSSPTPAGPPPGYAVGRCPGRCPGPRKPWSDCWLTPSTSAHRFSPLRQL